VHQFELEIQNEELKHAQSEMELSREKYFKLYDIAPVGYCTLSETGLVIEANLKACDLFGLDRTYLKRQLFASFIFKDDQHIYYQAVKNLSKTGDSQSCELRFKRRNGTLLWVLIDISSTQDADGVILYLVAVSDITARRQTEFELEKASTELAETKLSEDEALEYSESSISATRGSLIFLDHDLRVVFASRSFYEFFKATQEETLGQLIYNLGNKQWNIPEFLSLLKTILPEKTAFNNFEVSHDFDVIGRRIMLLNARQMQRQSGQERIILLGIEDITESKKAENVLTPPQRNYEIFFDNCGDFLFVLTKGGDILQVNNTVSTRLGYLKEELIGKSVLQVHPSERREEVTRIVGEMLSGTTGFCPVPLITKSGMQIPVETRVTPGWWDGRPVFFGVAKDMSDIMKSEEKFSKAFHGNSAACGFSDLTTGQYIEVNEAFYSLLGFEKNEVIGKNAVELGILTPDILRDLKLAIGNIEKIVNLETNIKAKNGDIKHVLLSADNVYLQERKCRFTVVIDITDQETAKQKLLENKIVTASLASRAGYLPGS